MAPICCVCAPGCCACCVTCCKMPTTLGWCCIAFGILVSPNVSSVLYYACCIYPVETAHRWKEEDKVAGAPEVVVCQPGTDAQVVSESPDPGN